LKSFFLAGFEVFLVASS